MAEQPESTLQRRRRVLASGGCIFILLFSAWYLPRTFTASAGVQGSSTASTTQPAPAKVSLSIDYPENGSIFPPGITPPTFIWRDAAATSWHITVSFSDDSPAIRALSDGQRIQLGPLDPQCVSDTNEPPKLTPKQAASWTWTPDPATWSAIQLHSIKPATLTISGYRNGRIAVTQSHIAFSTSTDKVGAPIFYRDVPLMPAPNINGTVQPLAPSAVHLIKWRLRDIRENESHVVLKDVPTCVNCHSFSRDGKTMGIDVDGPNNDKGLYAIAPVERHISIENKQVVQWNTDGTVGKIRVGFMSQISPDGQYVVSTFSPSTLDFPQTNYVRNFTDYRFLQVFYPTRGILEWYSRDAGRRQPLRGADDPRYVQTGGVWSPDGKYIVFARALARDPYDKNKPLANYATDPNETPIQYDLYRIPFNAGKGGTPERIAGASENGMSNSFPKVSPDSRWIVFVQCHNGEVMRPDGQLYIVPFEGGTARRLRANTPLMNSWHSFSPNGRWLVFSSKARSPYTQAYLTHIDADGNSSPAILIDNTTASNRAVNLPEFVNIAGDGIADIQIPAIKVYRLIEQALDMEDRKEFDKAEAIMRQAVALAPENADFRNDLSAILFTEGKTGEAVDNARAAVQINPLLVNAHYNLGAALMQQGHLDQALPELEKTLELNPRFPSGDEALADIYGELGRDSEALAHWRRALVLSPNGVTALMSAARILASSSDSTLRNGAEAVALAEQANKITSGSNPDVLDALAAAYAESGKFPEAVATAKHALELAEAKNDTAALQGIRYRLSLYTAHKPFRAS